MLLGPYGQLAADEAIKFMVIFGGLVRRRVQYLSQFPSGRLLKECVNILLFWWVVAIHIGTV